MTGAFRFGLQVKVGVGSELRDNKCGVKVFCCVILCEAQLEVGHSSS